tara:strand:- start:88 stop:243 length:156 start_codon:yes stop_codon:yes gene_type:complete
MKHKTIRTTLAVSLAMNFLLLGLLWILEARVAKLESKHSNNTPLNISFGKK